MHSEAGKREGDERSERKKSVKDRREEIGEIYPKKEITVDPKLFNHKCL